MIRYQTFITREINPRRRLECPYFSRSPAIRKVNGGENVIETVIQRLIVFDGQYQHTEIHPDGKATVEEFPDGIIITSENPDIDMTMNYFSEHIKIRIHCDIHTIETNPR